MFLALLFRVAEDDEETKFSVEEIRFIKFFIISFTVIFERFFLRVREPREEKRREEKRRERKATTRSFSWNRRPEEEEEEEW